MFDPVFPSVVQRILFFSVSLFAVLSVLDCARCIGQTLTYHRLLKDGAAESSLARIRPQVCANQFKQAIRSNAVFVGISLLVTYYYKHLQSLPWMLVALPVIFIITLVVTFVLTRTRFTTIETK